MIYCITSTDSQLVGDWVWTEVQVDSQDYIDLLDSVNNTLEYQTTIEKGVSEGWLTIIGPVTI
jgi:hypothetical protein